MRIRDIIGAKSEQGVVTVSPEASIHELVDLLAQHNVGALVVSTDGSTLTGIVSERDVVRGLKDDSSVLSAQVSSLMTSAVNTCGPDDQLDAVMGVMTQQRVRHIPVLEGDQLIGIVSIGDLVKHKIDALQFERDQLDSYVHQT